MKKGNNFAIIELEVLSGETIYDFIERMVKERDRLIKSDCFDFENFVMIGEFNECAVICRPETTKEEALKIYNKGINFSFVYDAYKYLGLGGEALIKEILSEESEKPLTIIEFAKEEIECPDEICRKILNLNEILAKDPYVPNYVIVGCFNDIAVVCRNENSFEDLMEQISVNKLPYKQVKNLYQTLGDQMDFVIANIAKVLTKEELTNAQTNLVNDINKIRTIMKNRLKKKEAMPTDKNDVFNGFKPGSVAYLIKDTDLYSKGTKVSVRQTSIINNVIPVIIAGVGDNLFCVTPDNLSFEKPARPLASYIDHTLLKANATKADVIKLCEEAKQYKFASVCVNPSFVALCNEMLKDTEVKVCTVIGFPLGANPVVDKTNESITAVENGADELDYVINIGAVKDHNWSLIKSECEAMAALQTGGKIVKVILETCLLDVEEIQKVCEIAARAGIEFVKTSTGFSTGGAEEHIVSLMKESVSVWNKNTKVKASGGIRTKEDALKMIEAGADRIGTSAGCTIVQ